MANKCKPQPPVAPGSAAGLRAVLMLMLFATPCCAEEPTASVRTAILVADAEKLYRDGKPIKAVELYDRAAARAFAEGATGKSFELSRTAAAIVESLGKHAQAGGRLRRAAMTNASHPEAAATHRSAIVLLAQASGKNPAAAKEYADAMQEFLEQWPDSKAFGEVRWWLAKWRMAQHQWRSAMVLLRAFDESDPRYAASLLLQGEAGVGRIAALRKGRGPEKGVRQYVESLTQRLQPIVTGEKVAWPSAWSPAQRAVALALAEVHLAYRKSGPQYPYKLLLAAAKGSPAPDDKWNARALPRLVEAALGAEEYETAEQWIARLPASSQGQCRQLARRLEPLLLGDADEGHVARVITAIANRFSNPPRPEWVARAAAVGAVPTERSRQAAPLLRELSEKSPGDMTLRQLYAVALAKQADEESLLESLSLWRQIESKSRPAGVRWRRARRARIELLKSTGRLEEAEKLIKLTELMYP